MEGVAPDAAGWTYAAVDGIEVTVMFSETVEGGVEAIKRWYRNVWTALSTTCCAASKAWP